DAVRLKLGGGEGGHNGLRDISRALGTKDYLRVRVGWAALPAAATPPTTCSPPSARPSAGRWRCWSRTRPPPSSPPSSRRSPPPRSASTPERPADHADRRSHPDHDPPAAAPAARPAGRRPRPHRGPRTGRGGGPQR